MKKYKQIMFGGRINDTVILRIADNASIPLDPANRDYQEYLKWLSEGNTPLPADEQGEMK
jgi:hypothetical protein